MNRKTSMLQSTKLKRALYQPISWIGSKQLRPEFSQIQSGRRGKKRQVGGQFLLKRLSP
jgi:hypothetical protein